MNSLVSTLRDFDECSVERYGGEQRVYWNTPLYREEKRQLNDKSVRRLIAAGYLIWIKDSQFPAYESLIPTARGMAIIFRYRPNCWKQPAIYPNYTNWLSNARRLKEYYKRIA